MSRILSITLFFLSLCSFKLLASEEPPLTICSSTECYTIIQELGEGAFGKVYAVENSLGQPFAIKTYKTPSDLSSPFLDAQREFSRGQGLNHPNIIKSHDFFMSDSEEGIAHIVLDLVDGKPLYKVERGEIEAGQEIVIQFIDALRYAFAMDLIHVDLHDGNIMIDKDSNIMIIDLASFFTRDEIQSYLFGKIASHHTQEEKKSFSVTPQISSCKACCHLQSQSEPSVLPLAPLRAAKLEKFFNAHPKILEEIKETFIANEALTSLKAKKTQDVSKNAAILATVKHLKGSSLDSTSIDISPFHVDYLSRITEVCMNLILKSEGDRDEKIQLRTTIKKIVWNYEEDQIEGINLPFATYLDQLFNTLQS